MTLDSTVFTISTYQFFPHLNALGNKFVLDRFSSLHIGSSFEQTW